MINAFRKPDALQLGAVFKSHVTNLGYTILNGDVLQG